MDWISVSERLPDKPGEILVLIGGELVIVTVYRDTTEFIWLEDSTAFLLPMYPNPQIVEEGTWILPKKWKEPTHWISIPQPPKG